MREFIEMKKYFLIFCILGFANIDFANAAYFYADALEDAIQNNIAQDLQSAVASEYEAQIDADGNISTDGMEQVCYAGNMDVSTADGAAACAAFVDNISNGCVYATGSSLKYYTNPQTDEERIKKCVFDKTIDYVISYEGGFQRNPNDAGNRICDKRGNPLKDEKGNYLLGATKMGITTCASGLSVLCIKNMTEKDARQYYWTRFYYKYGYYKLPVETLAAVMELAVGGTGTVAGELRAAAHIKNCGFATVIDDCIAEEVRKYIAENGVDKFYEDITALRAGKRSGKAKERALGVRRLSNLHKLCGTGGTTTFKPSAPFSNQ